MEFLQCNPPVDFTANKTAKDEAGYGCTKVSWYLVYYKKKTGSLENVISEF